MPWFKVDDRLHSHPKWVGTSLAARGLWATAGSWCADHSTDGEVPALMLRAWGATRRHADELVTQGLWEPAPDGWRFHDWLHLQPSAEQVEAERAAARDRQRRAREKAKSRRDSAVTHPQVTPAVTVPPTRPDPTPLVTRPVGLDRVGHQAHPEEPAQADFEPHPPARIPDAARTEGLATIATLRHRPTPDDAA